ncbi:uncharacterized protein LOC132937013 [Metopolophium dirhodum]|uniref:uncharacterized protein LOC132937013 n=1 Tax=Metopolophium dirhodum TaxID=44670 RepID=UPI00298FF92B|nr:uncharacterized protein LOC132937013 [Metopolophium dirhodum]
MTSITEIFILIIGIIAISGEALNSSNDTDLSSSRVSNRELLDTLESTNLVPSFERLERKCNGIIGFLGCITTDRSIINPLGSGIRPKRESIDIMTIDSKHGIRRERQQAVVKSKGSDDEPDSVMSLFTGSSSPLRSMIRNRSRRSASIPGTSSNKNTTVEVYPALVSDGPPKLSNNQRLLIMLLMYLTSPYLLIVPNKDYYQSDEQEIYYS